MPSPFPLPDATSGRRRHATAPCHTSFPWSQDELANSAPSSNNALSRHLPSRAEIEVLNPHPHRRPPSPALSHRLPSRAEIEVLNPHPHRQPPSPDSPPPTLQCYKKVISTLITVPTTRPHLHFTSSLARAPCYQSSTRRRHSLSPPSYVHRPSAQ
jgi:hypothetical protein